MIPWNWPNLVNFIILTCFFCKWQCRSLQNASSGRTCNWKTRPVSWKGPYMYICSAWRGVWEWSALSVILEPYFTQAQFIGNTMARVMKRTIHIYKWVRICFTRSDTSEWLALFETWNPYYTHVTVQWKYKGPCHEKDHIYICIYICKYMCHLEWRFRVIGIVRDVETVLHTRHVFRAACCNVCSCVLQCVVQCVLQSLLLFDPSKHVTAPTLSVFVFKTWFKLVRAWDIPYGIVYVRKLCVFGQKKCVNSRCWNMIWLISCERLHTWPQKKSSVLQQRIRFCEIVRAWTNVNRYFLAHQLNKISKKTFSLKKGEQKIIASFIKTKYVNVHFVCRFKIY